MKMKIYIAAKFSSREFLLDGILPRLAKIDIVVTSNWIADTLDFDMIDDKTRIELAGRDILDIEDAEVVILDTLGELSEGAGGGREFEAGLGLRSHGAFWRVGPPRSIFHSLADKSWANWYDFMDDLTTIRRTPL